MEGTVRERVRLAGEREEVGHGARTGRQQDSGPCQAHTHLMSLT